MISMYLQPKFFNNLELKNQAIRDICLFISNLEIFCTERALEKMNTSDFYVFFLDIVLVLFYSYHESYRSGILNIFRAFSLFSECKNVIYSKISSSNNSVNDLSDQNSKHNKYIKNSDDKNSSNYSTNESSVISSYNFSQQTDNSFTAKNNNNNIALTYKKNIASTTITSKHFHNRIIFLLKLRIYEAFSKLKQTLEMQQATFKANKFSNKTVDLFDLTNYPKEFHKHNENNTLYQETLDKMKSFYFSILKQLGSLISILTNFFVTEDFDSKVQLILNDGFIEMLKEMTNYFQSTYSFHKELEIKSNPYSYLKDYINQLYLLLFMIFPDAKIEFIGEKSLAFYKEENKKVAILMRLFDLLKANKENTDFTAKVVFCINRFLSNNILFKCYQDIFINIINELLPFLKRTENSNYIGSNDVNKSHNIQGISNSNNKQASLLLAKSTKFEAIVNREIYRLVYNLHLCANDLVLFLPVNSIKLNKDLSGINDIQISYKNPSIEHYSIKRENSLNDHENTYHNISTHNNHNANSLNKEDEFYYGKLATSNIENDDDEKMIAINNIGDIESEENKALSKFYNINNTKSEDLSKVYKTLMKKLMFLRKTNQFINNRVIDEKDLYKVQGKKEPHSEEFYTDLVADFKRKFPFNSFHPELIFFPPFKKILPYKEDKGCVFHGEHSLILNHTLELSSNYTILVRIFNPCPDTGKFHTLLQSDNKLGGLIVIDRHRTSLGCFTEDGKWIDSKINLSHSTYLNRWMHLALTYSEYDEQSKIEFFLNGASIASYTNEKLILPKRLKYIGNCFDYSEPFGIWCDLKIYKKVLNNYDITADYKDIYYKECFTTELNSSVYSLVANCLKTKINENSDKSDENRFYYMKLLNVFIANYSANKVFSDHESFMKIVNFMDTSDYSIKKEVAKYLSTVS